MAGTRTPHRTQTRHRPHLPQSRRARAVAVTGAAVLAALAIATPFVVSAAHDSGAGDPAAAPTPRPDRGPLPRGAFLGDVDGDGADDVVTLGHGDLLRADLGSGPTVGQRLQERPRLEGLADVGARGLAAVVSSGPHRHEWTVWVLRDSRWQRVPTRGSRVLGDQPGFATVWVTERSVYDGILDPLQKGQDHVVLVAHAWTLHDGKLWPTAAGLRCWDRRSEQPPAPCAPGQEWAYDVGPRGDLPALLPADRGRTAGPDGVTFASGDHWQLRTLDPVTESSAGPGTTHGALDYTGPGGTRSIRIRAGWEPTLYRSPVRVGDLTQGVLVGHESGDADTWRVYVQWGGRIQQLATRGPLPLGGGFGPDGDTAYLSWMGRDGRLYTRVGTARPGRFQVYAWQPVGGTAYDPPVLQATDLGTVCLDQTLGTYGTCARAK